MMFSAISTLSFASLLFCANTKSDWEPQWREKWLLQLLQAIIRSKSLTYLSFNALHTAQHSAVHTIIRTHTVACVCVCLSPVSSNLQSILALPARFEWISKIIHCATLCMMLACLCIWHRLAYTRANNVFLVHFLTDYELFSCFGWFKPNTQWTNARMKCKNKLKQTKERKKTQQQKRAANTRRIASRLDCLFGNWTKRVGLDINESKDDRTKETK